MQRFLSVLRKLLYPKGILLGLFSLVSAGGLFYVFANGLSEHPVSIAVYTFSAYSLTTVVLFIIRQMPRIRAGISSLPAVRRYTGDPSARSLFALQRSLLFGLLLAAYKAFAGFFYQSAWFVAMAFYYTVLSLQRGLLLRARKEKMRPVTAIAACGWLMLLLSMAVLGMRVLLFRDGERIVYPGHMIYAVALYAFYSMTVAILHFVRKQKRDPLQLAQQQIHAASALISILFLQAALLAAFSDSVDGARYANLATGGVTALIVFFLGIYTIVYGDGRQLSSETNSIEQ